MAQKNEDKKTVENEKVAPKTVEKKQTVNELNKIANENEVLSADAVKALFEDFDKAIEEDDDNRFSDWKKFDIQINPESYEMKENGVQLITTSINEDGVLEKYTIRLNMEISEDKVKGILGKPLSIINGEMLEIEKEDQGRTYIQLAYRGEGFEIIENGNEDNYFSCSTIMTFKLTSVLLNKKTKTLQYNSILTNDTRKDLFSIYFKPVTPIDKKKAFKFIELGLFEQLKGQEVIAVNVTVKRVKGQIQYSTDTMPKFPILDKK